VAEATYSSFVFDKDAFVDVSFVNSVCASGLTILATIALFALMLSSLSELLKIGSLLILLGEFVFAILNDFSDFE
jgi:hypothetical protein